MDSFFEIKVFRYPEACAFVHKTARMGMGCVTSRQILQKQAYTSIVFFSPKAPLEKRGSFNFSELLYEKNADPFALANRTHACSDCLALTGQAKVFVWRKLALIAEPTFCFSCKWFKMFTKEM